jgi:hypothetical protein
MFFLIIFLSTLGYALVLGMAVMWISKTVGWYYTTPEVVKCKDGRYRIRNSKGKILMWEGCDINGGTEEEAKRLCNRYFGSYGYRFPKSGTDGDDDSRFIVEEK